MRVGDRGFVLGGGHAVQLRGMAARPSEDIDLFSTDRGRPAEVETDVVAAFSRDQLTVTTTRRTADLVQMMVSEPDGEACKVDLGIFWRARAPVVLDIGPVLHPDDAACRGGGRHSVQGARRQAERPSATVNGVLLRHVTIDCADPYTLATFWSTVTGWPVSGVDKLGDDEVLIEAPAPVPGLLFIRVPEQKSVKNRIHFDWMPTQRTRDEDVERVIALGATLYEDHRASDGRGWVTLLDPEGNEFCIERSAAERES